MHGVGFSKSSSSRRSMSLLSPMYTHVHPVPRTYTPDVLGVFARMPFLVNGHTGVPAHGGIAASCVSGCFSRPEQVCDQPVATSRASRICRYGVGARPVSYRATSERRPSV